MSALVRYELSPDDAGKPCWCLCGLNHAKGSAICQGRLHFTGYRAWFDSPFQAHEGTVICVACIEAMT